MANECYNSVWFEGTRVSELISAFQDYETEGEYSILEKMVANNKPSSKIPFYDITTYDDSIWFCSKKRPSVKVLKAICKEFECDFILRYNEPIAELHGLITYWHDNDLSQIYQLSNNDIEKISYLETDDNGEIDFCGSCILEGITYSCDLEAFDVLLDRKASNSNLSIRDAIEGTVQTILEKKPELFKESMNPMFPLVLKMLNALVDRYNAHEYINYNSKLIDKVLCANSYEEISNYVRCNYVDEVLKGIKNHKDYFKGIEISNDETNFNTYMDIQYVVVEEVADKLLDKSVDAFYDWEIEAKLYFLILVDKNKITPTKEMFKDFMDNLETFTREMNIPQLLAA